MLSELTNEYTALAFLFCYVYSVLQVRINERNQAEGRILPGSKFSQLLGLSIDLMSHFLT